MKHGIDVSEFQDPSIIAKVNPDFVLIRAGYSLSEDAAIEAHAAECERLGIPYGFYWYSYAMNGSRAEEEAAKFLDVISGYDPAMGLWLDMEDGDGYKEKHGFSFSSLAISNICLRFCSLLERSGYYAGIYISESWKCYLTEYVRNRFDLWVAYWGDNSGDPSGEFPSGASLWQYTSNYNGLALDADLCRYDDISFYDLDKEISVEDKIENLERRVKRLEDLIK